MKVIVVAPKVPVSILDKNILACAYVIAVDQAVDALNKAEIKYDLAIGDFDSLEDINHIKGDYIKLNPIKDESDTYKAITVAYSKSDDVELYGGLAGHRIDHLYANLLLLQRFKNLIIYNEHNKIYGLPKGMHHLDKNHFKYISFFAFNEAKITLTGFKYDLVQYILKKDNPIGLSNEKTYEACIEILEGEILVIESND